MKRAVTVILLLMTLLMINAQVEFRQVLSSEDMDAVWADAVRQNKAVFVDIYATWCGPCKWLDANVFETKVAGEYMNKEFINVKLDGESDFGRVFAMKSGLSAYPSLFLFNSEQKLMNMMVGAKPWEELHPEMVSTLEYFPVLELLQNKFEAELLKKEEYPRFTKALREMGKLEYGDAVVRKYQKEFVVGNKRTIEDIQVLAFYTEQGTENWSNLLADISTFKTALGDDLESFVDHMVSTAIELSVENRELDYIKQMNDILPSILENTSMNAEKMETRSYIYYYHYSELIDEMISYIDHEYITHRKGDHAWLFAAAADAVFLDPQNTPVAEKGLEWFQKCLDIKETQEYYYHLALCEYFTDSPDKTVSTLRKSLEFTDDKETIESTLLIIEEIEGE